MIDDLYMQARLRDLARECAQIASERRALAYVAATRASAQVSALAARPCEPADSLAA